jgi:hypothetical protein
MDTLPKRHLTFARKSRSIIELNRRRLEPDKLRGMIIGFSPSLVLLQILNDEIKLNGYSIIRRRDISRFQPAEHADFYSKVLKLRHLAPRIPRGVMLDTVSSAIASSARRYPLITIHQERKDPDCCYIGTPHLITNTTLHLKCINHGATWDPDPFQYRLDSITRIDFGGAYEEALAIASESHTKPRRIRIRKQQES